jgi:hypothetical protein
MKIIGYDISLTTAILLFILVSIISLNITWSCCLSPAIETMKVVNKKKLNDKIKK